MSAVFCKGVGPMLGLLAVAMAGCVAPKGQLEALRVENRVLADQNRAQLVEIANLKNHSRTTEDRLRRAEEDLALFEERIGLGDRQLANYRQQSELLQEQFMDMVNGRGQMPPGLGAKLAEIARENSSLRFDPQTGVAKLDTDILFDSGKAELKPGAEKLLAQLARVLNAPEADDLRLMVVGHTDDQPIAKMSGGETFATNFQLSTARALAVAKTLRAEGVKSERMGVAGFGAHQPIAPGTTPAERHKNRRVELFVLAPDVPVVGWTETMPSVY